MKGIFHHAEQGSLALLHSPLSWPPFFLPLGCRNLPEGFYVYNWPTSFSHELFLMLELSVGP
jgi:hypothetical protein